MTQSERFAQLESAVAQFAADRDWDQFHSPKNLTMALSGEVGELIEHFQWLTQEESERLPETKLHEVKSEVADVFLYLIRLSQKLEINLVDVAFDKIAVNAKKYPADTVRGSARKYTEYDN